MSFALLANLLDKKSANLLTSYRRTYTLRKSTALIFYQVKSCSRRESTSSPKVTPENENFAQVRQILPVRMRTNAFVFDSEQHSRMTERMHGMSGRRGSHRLRDCQTSVVLCQRASLASLLTVPGLSSFSGVTSYGFARSRFELQKSHDARRLPNPLADVDRTKKALLMVPLFSSAGADLSAALLSTSRPASSLCHRRLNRRC